LRVCENGVLRRMLRLEREEVARGWRRLLNEKLQNLYTSPNIIRMRKSRRIIWAGHVEHISEMRNNRTFLSENLKVGDCLEDLDIEGKIILERILGK
jgi:hypothetical protein